MRELDFLNIIHKKLDSSEYLGDDCAYLDDLNIFVTQDTLVEDVHFTKYTITPYLLGRKSISVNLSDLAAALALPLYVTVSISLPVMIEDNFVSELYRGINDICNEYSVKVIGGDITSSDKIVISVCAVGKKTSKYITSRSFAKKNDYVLVTGEFGSSGAGLFALSSFLYADASLINAHLNPTPRVKEAKQIASKINSNIAVMDASDGLIDALYKIAQASKRCIKIDINSVPVNKALVDFCNYNKLDRKNFVKWGAEDYELVLCVPEDVYLKLDKKKYTLIGRVLNKDNNPSVYVTDNDKTEVITKEAFESNSFNHFS